MSTEPTVDELADYLIEHTQRVGTFVTLRLTESDDPRHRCRPRRARTRRPRQSR